MICRARFLLLLWFVFVCILQRAACKQQKQKEKKMMAEKVVDKVVDKAFDKLEGLWRLGWRGYRDFPHDARHRHLKAESITINHHRRPSLSLRDIALGLPADGIMERRRHPLRRLVSALYGHRSPIATHLTALTDARAIDPTVRHLFTDHMPYGSVDPTLELMPPYDLPPMMSDMMMDPYMMNMYSGFADYGELFNQFTNPYDMMNTFDMPIIKK